MNVKLAWEIGRRLGMQKKAAPPATTKAFKSFPLPDDNETTPGSFLSAIVGPRGDIGGPRKDSYTLAGEAAGYLPYSEPSPTPWAGGGTAAKQKADATVGAKAGPLSLSGATSSGATPDANGVMSLSNKGVAGAGPDANGVLSVGGAGGGSAAQGGQATHRRNIQLHGVDAANRMKAGGGQQGQENDFWSSVPSPASSKQITADMYNKFLGFNSPAEYSGWREARTSGLGRALKARGDDQFARMMLGNI